MTDDALSGPAPVFLIAPPPPPMHRRWRQRVRWLWLTFGPRRVSRAASLLTWRN